jgi:pyruvate formate lyase activating enzyme
MPKIIPAWNASNVQAKLWSRMSDGSVQCHLSPRNCNIQEGRVGFCRVRQNINGRLISLNYGRATQLTQELIETEAVFHHSPGARILSLGNIGCMMACDYCHNWSTSQAPHVNAKTVKEYTPEQVVDIAEELGIKVLSWTYNDPVVWHEFVLDTASIAKKRGIKNLYKSAFFISMEAADELCDVIDIFSVSIKTMDAQWYKKISKGWMEPVLDATIHVFNKKKHVEISNLMVTDANDSESDARAMAQWVLDELSDQVPLHFVRFHPDYRYTHVGRTPLDRLARARQVALNMGVKHCYLGNVYDDLASSTYCLECQATLIKRYGLTTWFETLGADGCCKSCGTRAPIKEIELSSFSTEARVELECSKFEASEVFHWDNDINACHVEANSIGDSAPAVYYSRLFEDGTELGPFDQALPESGGRFILTKSDPREIGVNLHFDKTVAVKIYPVLDRAHYPTDTLSSHSLAKEKVLDIK